MTNTQLIRIMASTILAGHVCDKAYYLPKVICKHKMFLQDIRKFNIFLLEMFKGLEKWLRG